MLGDWGSRPLLSNQFGCVISQTTLPELCLGYFVAAPLPTRPKHWGTIVVGLGCWMSLPGHFAPTFDGVFGPEIFGVQNSHNSV